MTVEHTKLRVLVAVPTPPPYSGPEVVGALLLRSGLGSDIELIHVRTNAQTSNATKGHVTLSGLCRLAVTWARTLGSITKRRPHLLYLYLSQNPTGFLRDLLFIVTARCAGVGVVVQVHGANFSNFVLDSSPLFRWVIRSSFRWIDDVVVLAERLKQQFAGLVSGDRLWVVYNAVSRDRAWDLRRESDGCTFLFIGHLSVAKGFVDLLRAVPAVLDAVPDARFEFAGEWLTDERNIRRDEHTRRVRDHGLPEVEFEKLSARYGSRIRHLGLVSGTEKVEALQRADVFVLPSYSEGFPIAVLEAMDAGLPLIVTPVGALPEVLTPDEHALFVAQGDIDALSNALLRMAQNSDLRAKMGGANALLVHERFTPARTLPALQECLLACAARGARA